MLERNGEGELSTVGDGSTLFLSGLEKKERMDLRTELLFEDVVDKHDANVSFELSFEFRDATEEQDRGGTRPNVIVCTIDWMVTLKD